MDSSYIKRASLIAEFLFCLTDHKLGNPDQSKFESVFKNLYAYKPHELAGMILYEMRDVVDVYDREQTKKVYYDIIDNFESKMTTFRAYYNSPVRTDKERIGVFKYLSVPQSPFPKLDVKQILSFFGVKTPFTLEEVGEGVTYEVNSFDRFLFHVRADVKFARNNQQLSISEFNSKVRSIFMWDDFFDHRKFGQPLNILRIITRTMNRQDGYSFDVLDSLLDNLEQSRNFSVSEKFYMTNLSQKQPSPPPTKAVKFP